LIYFKKYSVEIFSNGKSTLNGILNCIKDADEILCEEFYSEAFRNYTYKYVLIFHQNQLTVKQSSGALLHQFEFKTSDYPIKSTHSHLCVKDMYSAEIVFHSKSFFELTYHVYGPEKDYEMIKKYTAIG
jgi:hypothetical protein